MFVVRHSTIISAPIERCFALSTSVAVVEHELHMKPVAGRTSGLVEAGDTVRWEGQQLGFWNFHVSEIRHFDAPHFFQDHMIAGRFRDFEHDHRFTETPEGTRLDDEIRFTLPFGPLGWLVGRLILKPHVERLLKGRFRLLKHLAETDAWRTYLPS